MSKEKAVQQDASAMYALHPIAKTFLYITGFIILVRCDLWISLCVLIIATLMLFPMVLLKKLKDCLSKQNLATLNLQLQRWYQQHVVGQSDNKAVTVKKPLVATRCQHKHVHPQTNTTTPAVTTDFTPILPVLNEVKDESFADIWKDYPVIEIALDD